MSDINTKHVLLGGVAAAVVLTAGDFVVNNYVLDAYWRHLGQTHNVDMFKMSGTAATVTFVVVDCALGFLLAWLYAAVRPRLGPGPGTAFIATAVVWGVAALQMATYGGWFIPWDLVIRSSALLFVTMLAAGLAAAWVYREDEPSAWTE
jgi:hypothetical protein